MLDPITVSVLNHRFEAIVQEMGEAMLRTAYSQILNSSGLLVRPPHLAKLAEQLVPKI